MRKITFDTKTIEEIRNFINDGHTLGETCNKFTIKHDTLRRVMYENNISSSHPEKASCKKEITQELADQVCTLFKIKTMRMADIAKELKLQDYIIQDIIRKNFTQEEIDKKHAELYRQSKLGDKNPSKRFTGKDNPRYMEELSDGNGYLMQHRPDWYTGRKNKVYVFSHHVAFCLATGLTEIPQGFVIHHIDGNKTNNDISNLSMMSVSAHAKLHSIERNLCKVQRLSHTGVGSNSEAPNTDCDNESSQR